MIESMKSGDSKDLQLKRSRAVRESRGTGDYRESRNEHKGRDHDNRQRPKNSFITCICYPEPSHSTYHVIANDYFDNLLCQISQYQDINPFYMCGHFNARCGDLSDFIKGIDNLPLMYLIDYSYNANSDMVIDFLINVNCCIVNCRNSVHSYFTFESPRGCSAVFNNI